MEMLQGPFPMTLPGQLGIMGQAELDGSPDDLFGLDEPVGLGDDPPVQGAGFMVR